MDLNKIEDEAKGEVKLIEGQAIKAYTGLTKHFDLLHIILIVIAVICATSIAWNVFKPSNPVTPSQFVQPPGIREVEKIKTIPVPGPQIIYVYPKDQVNKEVKLPEAFKNNTSAKVISSADLQPSKAGYKVLGTLTTDKNGIGKGGILAEEKERSFLGLPSNLSVGARYGVVTDGTQEGSGFVKYQPIRFGNLYLGLVGEVTTKKEGKGLIEMEYKIKSD